MRRGGYAQLLMATALAVIAVACSVAPSVSVYNRTAGNIVLHRLPDNLDRRTSIDELITVEPGRSYTIKEGSIRRSRGDRHLTLTVGACTYFYRLDDLFERLDKYYMESIPVEVLPDLTLYPLPYQNGEVDRVPRAKLGFPRPPTSKRCATAAG
jgi:hypothetical protein